MKMRKKLTLALAAVMLLSALPLSSCGSKKSITVYATSEDYRIENAQKMFDEKFPEYDIHIEYKSTGDLSSKLIAEGDNTDCDIIMELENAYMEKISDSLAELKDVDFSVYKDTYVPDSLTYPTERQGYVRLIRLLREESTYRYEGLEIAHFCA